MSSAKIGYCQHEFFWARAAAGRVGPRRHQLGILACAVLGIWIQVKYEVFCLACGGMSAIVLTATLSKLLEEMLY